MRDPTFSHPEILLPTPLSASLAVDAPPPFGPSTPPSLELSPDDSQYSLDRQSAPSNRRDASRLLRFTPFTFFRPNLLPSNAADRANKSCFRFECPAASPPRRTVSRSSHPSRSLRIEAQRARVSPSAAKQQSERVRALTKYRERYQAEKDGEPLHAAAFLSNYALIKIPRRRAARSFPLEINREYVARGFLPWINRFDVFTFRERREQLNAQW